jgi:ABC-type Na+ transport system ATPase subunit NatA
MNKKIASKLKAQYLCGIITEAQYHEALMTGGPNRFDPSGKAAPYSSHGTHELGEVHAVIHGGELILSSKGAMVHIKLRQDQIEEILTDLGEKY